MEDKTGSNLLTLIDQRRARQAETISKIVQARTRPNDRFIILGDMNDSPDSPYLAGFATDATLGLVNALTNPKESRPAPHDDMAPTTKAWTHRVKPTGQPAKYELYDQIWISRALSAQLVDATIERRKNFTGDGSDHDPAWVRISF